MSEENKEAAVETKEDQVEVVLDDMVDADIMSDEKLLEHLLEKTHFSKREIEMFLDYSKDSRSMSKEQFKSLLVNSGIKIEEFQDRLWDSIDSDDNGNIDIVELVMAMNILTHGTTESVTKFFFDIYDINKDGFLSKEELIEVYGQVLKDCTHTTITEEQTKKIGVFLMKADTSKDGQLSFDEFKAGVEAAVKKFEEEEAKKRTWKTMAFTGLLIFLTFWFEMGTSFALPAMGALSLELQTRFGINDSTIGTLTGLYYLSAVIGPMIGGLILDRRGPSIVLLGSNVLVLVGSILQVVATKDAIFVLYMARLIIGLGGEVTAFSCVEILNRLFGSKLFMTMAGVRNLVQSASGFFAFVLLPLFAESVSVDFALWFIVIMSLVSTASSIIAMAYLNRLKDAASKLLTPAKMFKSIASHITPTSPSKWADFKMPASFYLAIFGIKCFYLPPFAFTAFSIKLFTQEPFNLTSETASFLSGFISLLAGLTGPGFGPLSDYWGNRSISLGGFILPAFFGFILFAATTWTPWIGICFLALTYGFGDTVAFASIRLIVGEKRAGLGYGIYSLGGNILSFAVPVIGGQIFVNSGGDALCYYFAVLMAIGVACWFVVRKLEGSKAPLELRARDLVDTEDKDVNAASLFGIIGKGKDIKEEAKAEEKPKAEEEPKAVVETVEAVVVEEGDNVKKD